MKKYVVLKIENKFCGKFDYISWDVYLKESDGHTFVAEFESYKDAHMFKRTKNSNLEAQEYRKKFQ